MKVNAVRDKLISDERTIYTLIVVILSIVMSQITYQGGRMATRGLPHTDMTAEIDTLIPFLPWTVAIYFGTFAFWIVSFYFIIRMDRPDADRFFCAQHITYIVTLIIFLLLPTTNIRPEITGNTIWDGLMRFLYSSDPPDGLFPSLHCIVSWLCWLGLRKNKKLPLACRLLTLFIAISICVSTLTTKQHVIADAIGGILLSEVCYIIAGSSRVRGIYTRFINGIICSIRDNLKKGSAG